MKKVILQNFTKEGVQKVEVVLSDEQAEVVTKYGWPDAVGVTPPLGSNEVYTLEDWDGDTATYTKVNYPLFLCSPIS